MTGEPFLKTLFRNTLAAALIGILVFLALPRRGSIGWDYFDAFAVALCFALIGHYIEVLLLKLPGIDTGAGRLVRMAGWFGGGLWCYVVARFLWLKFGRDLGELPPLWFGGVFLVALELIIHLVVRAQGRPNFYSGQSSVISRQ